MSMNNRIIYKNGVLGSNKFTGCVVRMQCVDQFNISLEISWHRHYFDLGCTSAVRLTNRSQT